MARPTMSTVRATYRLASQGSVPASSRRTFLTASAAATTAHRVVSSSSSSPSTSSSVAARASSSNSARSRRFHTSHRASNNPKSPFQVFVDVLREELRKNREMQENMRQLQGDVGKLQDSETLKKMRETYERARIITSIKENPRLQKAAEALRKNGGQVGDAVAATLKQMEDSELIKGLGAISSRLSRQLDNSTAPIRNTEAYKQLSQTLVEAFDDGGSALRIVVDAEADARTIRRIKREARLKKIGRLPPSEDVDSPEYAEAVMKAHDAQAEAEAAAAAAEEAASSSSSSEGQGQQQKDSSQEEQPQSQQGQDQQQQQQQQQSQPQSETLSGNQQPPETKTPRGYAVRVRSFNPNAQAGQALVLRPEPAYKQAWASFKSNNPLMRKLSEYREVYDESENPVVERVRGVTEWIGGLFEENEFARVTRAMKMMDPSFNMELFQRDLREYVVPEIIDAYHGAQRHLLRQWCGEATFNLLMATIDPYISKGMLPEGRLLDIRHIDVLQAKMLDNNIPVLVISFTSQELMFFKDPKTGNVKAGNSEQADMCRYAMVLTRVENELDNEITGGWKVVELARRGQAAYL